MTAHKRLAAVIALLSGAVAIGVACGLAVANFPRGVFLLGLVAASMWLALFAIARRGARRAAGLGGAILLLVAAVVILVSREPVGVIAVAVAASLSVAAAREAFRGRVELPAAARPRAPVLFYNPRSGGGKAARFALPDEARARGIKPVELAPGTDLEELVRTEVAAGADALAMAGGDGSQAVVAGIAAEHRLPYACIPAGTRNHFALDLGVDRNDVVGALDAFVDGGARVVDLAEVSGRVFVNNVSLGLYAAAVQRAGYRDAKLRTLLDTVPDVAGPEAAANGLSWHGPDGEDHGAGVVMLVSNNCYRLGRAVGSGTRPSLDAGELGVVVFGADGSRRRQEWAAPALDVEAGTGRLVAVGIDGEAVELPSPLRFRIRPRVLHVRIARAHPGASPAALRPDGAWAELRGLARIAFWRG